MKLNYNNRLGLLTLIGMVAGIVGAGSVYAASPLYTIPFILLAIACGIVFVKFVYHFVYYHPLGEIPDEEAKEEYRDND